MKIQKNIENIVISLQELNIITENLKLYTFSSEHQNSIPQIDIDLALSKIRSIYNELLIVNKLNSVVEEISIISIPEIKEEVKSEPIIKKEELPFIEEKPVFQIIADEEISVPENVLEKKQEPAIELPKEKIPDVKIEKITEIKNEIKQLEIIPERKAEDLDKEIKVEASFVNQKKESIIDTISKNEQSQDFVTKLQQKPIADINEALSLGEKLLYINELFGKNSDKFNEAVKYINHCTAMEDALFYIENNFKWDFEKEATISFMELVKRKFL